MCTRCKDSERTAGMHPENRYVQQHSPCASSTVWSRRCARAGMNAHVQMPSSSITRNRMVTVTHHINEGAAKAARRTFSEQRHHLFQHLPSKRTDGAKGEYSGAPLRSMPANMRGVTSSNESRRAAEEGMHSRSITFSPFVKS